MAGVLPLKAQCPWANASRRSEGCEDPACWQKSRGRPSGFDRWGWSGLGVGQQWPWSTWPGWHQMQASSNSSAWHGRGWWHHCDGCLWSTPYSSSHQPRKGTIPLSYLPFPNLHNSWLNPDCQYSKIKLLGSCIWGKFWWTVRQGRNEIQGCSGKISFSNCFLLLYKRSND